MGVSWLAILREFATASDRSHCSIGRASEGLGRLKESPYLEHRGCQSRTCQNLYFEPARDIRFVLSPDQFSSTFPSHDPPSRYAYSLLVANAHQHIIVN